MFSGAVLVRGGLRAMVWRAWRRERCGGLVFIAPQLAPNLSAVDLVAGRYLFYGLTAAVVMVVQIGRPSRWMRR